MRCYQGAPLLRRHDLREGRVARGGTVQRARVANPRASGRLRTVFVRLALGGAAVMEGGRSLSSRWSVAGRGRNFCRAAGRASRDVGRLCSEKARAFCRKVFPFARKLFLFAAKVFTFSENVSTFAAKVFIFSENVSTFCANVFTFFPKLFTFFQKLFPFGANVFTFFENVPTFSAKTLDSSPAAGGDAARCDARGAQGRPRGAIAAGNFAHKSALGTACHAVAAPLSRGAAQLSRRGTSCRRRAAQMRA